MQQQIIALGGGSSVEREHLMDSYLLRCSGKERPRVCFVPTACGDAESSIRYFYKRFSAYDCEVSDLQLFSRSVRDLVEFASSQDVIFVGGGNTANMLAIWRLHGFDIALERAVAGGTVLAGSSAGSICWFEEGVTDSFGIPLHRLDCLGFLAGSNCPHYDSEVERRPSYQGFIGDGMRPGYAADDGVGLHFINGALAHVVSTEVRARGFRVELINGEVRETELDTRLLVG